MKLYKKIVIRVTNKELCSVGNLAKDLLVDRVTSTTSPMTFILFDNRLITTLSLVIHGNSYLPLTVHRALTHLTHSQLISLVHLYVITFSISFYNYHLCFFLVHSAASPQRKAQYYVYCKTCKSVTPGKLRVRCSLCREGAMVLHQVATQLFKSVFRNKDLLISFLKLF